jgi:hypothetical protein
MRFFFKISALSLCTVSASAPHIEEPHINKWISTLEQRLLAEGDSGQCMSSFLMDAAGSFSNGLTAPLFGYLDVNADMPKICPDLSSCDISQTDYAKEFRQGCVGGGKQVFEGNRVSICRDSIDDLKDVLPLLPLDANMTNIDDIIDVLDSLEEIEITGIPVCLDSACPANIDIKAELSTMVGVATALLGSGTAGVNQDTLNKVIGIADRLLEGKKCTSASNGKWTAFAGALALGACFFTL